MAKRICSAVLIFAILLLCGFSISSPPRNLCVYWHTNEDIVKTFSVKDIDSFNSCHLEGGGKIKVTGGDAGIVFENIDTDFKSIKINVEKKENSVPVQIFIDKGEGYIVKESPYAHILKGNNSISLNVEGQGVKLLRIDIDEDYTLSSLELHKNSALKEKYNPPVPYVLYGITVGLALLLTILFFILDKKYDFTQKAVEFFISNRKNILVGIGAVLVCGSVSALIEWIVSLSEGGGFKEARFGLICAATLLIALFWLCRKIMSEKTEKLVLGAILILGIAFATLRPFGHVAWDFDSHYRMALCSSYGGTVYITEADRKCLNANSDSLISLTAEENALKIEAMQNSSQILSSVERGRPRITHLSMGVPMAVARFLGADFLGQMLAGRIGNVVLYALLCYFAIKKLKSGKVLMSIIALLPTSLFLSASYSYDTWVTGFVFLGMAYFIRELQEPRKLAKTKNTVIMCACFGVACIPKAIYAPLLLLPFFIHKENFKEYKKRYFGICAAMLALLLLFFAVKSLGIVSGTGDTRGGAVNPMEQIGLILGDPLRYAKILFGFLKEYFAPHNADQYMLHFAYAGIGKGKVIILLLLMVAFLSDKDKDVNTDYKWYIRTVTVCMFFGISVLIATSMYVAFTPVGSEVINGCQPRYMIPLIYPLLSVLGIKGIYIKSKRTVYNYLMIIPMVLINLYNVYYVFLPRI